MKKSQVSKVVSVQRSVYDAIVDGDKDQYGLDIYTCAGDACGRSGLIPRKDGKGNKYVACWRCRYSGVYVYAKDKSEAVRISEAVV